MKSKIKLRYGENPNQKGYLINDKKKSIFNYQVSGKQISYNNLIDLDSGLRCLKEFLEPTSIILKHTNPCGVASAKNIEIAFNRSYESDPKSAFGGIILLNRNVSYRLAKKLYKNFYEMIVAVDFDKDALLWQKGVVSFNNTPFREVMRTLERHYNIQIEDKKG